jgi:AcrR family transcriptional regulator
MPAKDSSASPAPRSVEGYKHGRVPREVRRGQLLDLAEGLFMQKGYVGFWIDDLSRAAGVSRPTVYRHFGSKDGIYLACVRRIAEEFEQALVAGATSAPDLATAVNHGAEAWFSILEREPQRWSLLYGGATGLGGPLADQLADLRDATVRQIGMILTRYAPRADSAQVNAWAHAVSGAGEQLGRLCLRNPDIPRQGIVAIYSDFLLLAAKHLIASTQRAIGELRPSKSSTPPGSSRRSGTGRRRARTGG